MEVDRNHLAHEVCLICLHHGFNDHTKILLTKSVKTRLICVRVSTNVPKRRVHFGQPTFCHRRNEPKKGQDTLNLSHEQKGEKGEVKLT